jgi:hypothetical protein
VRVIVVNYLTRLETLSHQDPEKVSKAVHLIIRKFPFAHFREEEVRMLLSRRMGATGRSGRSKFPPSGDADDNVNKKNKRKKSCISGSLSKEGQLSSQLQELTLRISRQDNKKKAKAQATKSKAPATKPTKERTNNSPKAAPKITVVVHGVVVIFSSMPVTTSSPFL